MSDTELLILIVCCGFLITWMVLKEIHKNGKTFNYSKLKWNLAFGIVFLMGVIVGILI
jgi:uncharacterized integral membrane protein